MSLHVAVETDLEIVLLLSIEEESETIIVVDFGFRSRPLVDILYLGLQRVAVHFK